MFAAVVSATTELATRTTVPLGLTRDLPRGPAGLVAPALMVEAACRGAYGAVQVNPRTGKRCVTVLHVLGIRQDTPRVSTYSLFLLSFILLSRVLLCLFYSLLLALLLS